MNYQKYFTAQIYPNHAPKSDFSEKKNERTQTNISIYQTLDNAKDLTDAYNTTCLGKGTHEVGLNQKCVHNCPLLISTICCKGTARTEQRTKFINQQDDTI